MVACEELNNDSAEENLMFNYSGTHSVAPKLLHCPNSQAELEALVKRAHVSGNKIRPVGTFLSPNGIASSDQGMVSMANCDKILSIDLDRLEVTVEGGAVVSSVLEALEPHGLTLGNFSSIKEQQMGGWTQVGAHGTGARLPTVDEMITRMKLVTPAYGTLELSDSNNASDQDKELFKLARCGLGSLGIVSEMTLQCVPAHRLIETTKTAKVSEVRSLHADRLRRHQHVRYMWIPYSDTMVTVISDPEGSPALKSHPETPKRPRDPLKPMKELLASWTGLKSLNVLESLPLAELRDRLVDMDPGNLSNIKAINAAESEVWKNCQGVREGKSDEILGFDCGGQQWVLEMAFPTGTLENNSMADIDFVMELKRRLEEEGVPAPSPIEQRWTSASSSYMSPAYSANPDTLFSWIGIIMYMPPGQDSEARAQITERFSNAAAIMRDVGKKYGAVPHWAKIEIPDGPQNACELKETLEMRRSLRQRYDVARFNAARKRLDPKGVLSNPLVDVLFGE